MEKTATQGQERYQDELNVVQRATRAETRVNNVESALTEARKFRDEMQATVISEWSRANREEGRANEAEGKALAEYNRAQAAEEKVRKYKKDKAGQDRRMINQSEQPDKVKLLREMYRARGDEQIEWDDDDPLSEPSSDEDDAEVRHPSFRRKRLPKSRDVMVVVLGELME